MQEPEIEYVEGYDELEEEEDMEDFGGPAMFQSLTEDDNGEGDSIYLLLNVFFDIDLVGNSLVICPLCIYINASGP